MTITPMTAYPALRITKGLLKDSAAAGPMIASHHGTVLTLRIFDRAIVKLLQDHSPDGGFVEQFLTDVLAARRGNDAAIVRLQGLQPELYRATIQARAAGAQAQEMVFYEICLRGADRFLIAAMAKDQNRSVQDIEITAKPLIELARSTPEIPENETQRKDTIRTLLRIEYKYSPEPA